MVLNNKFFNIDNQVLVLQGNWSIENSAAIIDEIKSLPKNTLSGIDAAKADKMDSWGAYYLKELIERYNVKATTNQDQQKLLDFLPDNSPSPIKLPQSSSHFVESFSFVGEKSIHAVQEIAGVLNFIGETSIRFVKNFAHPKSFRFHSIIRHINETGIRAVPIIGLLAVLISMVISYQAATQLQKFGASIFTVDLTVISLLREMAVLVTSIMVAGRSGSAFAAEIGVMKLREEVDALRTMGMDPIEVLVLPRVIALMITLPILTFLSIIVGLIGGCIISVALLDIPVDQYISRVQTVAKPTMFFVGMIKAPVFAFIIAIIGTYQGMNISGSAESVGKLTTVSVVQSIFLVIMADAIFSIIFAQLGI